VCEITAPCTCLTLDDEGIRVFRNVGNHQPSDKASHPRRPECPEIPLREPQVSKF
jgi:hypothetical protein